MTAIFAVIFATGITLLLGLVYIQTAAYLTRRIDSIISNEAKFLTAAGPDALPGRLAQEAASDPLSRLGLFSFAGDRIAGNTNLSPATLIVDGRPRNSPGHGGEGPSRVLAERTSWGEILIVGRDTRQVAALRHIVLTALLWSGAAIAILGLLSAVALSLRPLARISAMRRASDGIGAGDFTLRLPVAGRGDELDELARIANRMMDEAERLMTEARTVGQGVAHELRSPLTRLRAMLDHASGLFDGDDPRRQLLERCVAEADTVLARFQALLRIAALEARGRRTGFGRVSLSDMVGQILELFGPLAADLGIELTADTGTDVTIGGDGELLFEALSNLVDNALKFTGAGGHVTVSAGRTANGARLVVRDDGPGIPEAERSFVTRRFYRGQKHAGVPGHGLGLSLVAAVADLHGFTLRLGDAEPGAIVEILCAETGPRPSDLAAKRA
jgi:signal transduction histidine kinase